MTNDKGRVTEKGECSEKKQKGEGGNDGFFFYISCIYYKIHYFCGCNLIVFSR